jgi:hypothetical protein
MTWKIPILLGEYRSWLLFANADEADFMKLEIIK